MLGAPRRQIPTLELVVLLGTMMSLGALTQDIMLPALRLIDLDLNLGGSNDAQYVVTASLVGIGAGQLFYGPLSDSWGRRITCSLAWVFTLLGSIVCISSGGFGALLIGRALQDLGAASPRVLSITLARDLYEGRAMARIVSYVMAIQMAICVSQPNGSSAPISS